MKSFMMPFIPETTYLRRKKTRFGRPGLFSVPGTVGGRAQEQGAACIDSQCNFSTIDAAVNIRQPLYWLIMAGLVGLSAALTGECNEFSRPETGGAVRSAPTYRVLHVSTRIDTRREGSSRA
jgi:hypothetical protein